MKSKDSTARFDPFTCPLDGAHFVEASAGTGKTFCLSWVVARLVIERAAPIDEILVVTFTNAATAELIAAVRERLKSALDHLTGSRRDGTPELRGYLGSVPDAKRAADLARTALADLDRAAILSIHGFCQRTLSERAFESGVPFEAKVIEDDAAFCARIADDFWSREVYEATPSRVEELAAAGWSVDRAHEIAGILARDPEVELVPSADSVARDVDARAAVFVREAFAARRGASAALSFNDLLYELDRALADGSRGTRLTEALQARYRAALVDEFQDTNAVQYRIFRRIFRDAGRPFFVFGDPKQAIYRFRGGDIFTYLRAAAEPGARRWSLEVNHRSDEGVVRAVNALFGGGDPFRCGGRIEYRPASVRSASAGRRPLTSHGVPRAPFEIAYADPAAVKAGDVAPGIAADIAGLLASDIRFDRAADGEEPPREVRLTARDIAVLTRTNAQAGSIAEALRHRGIAAATTSDMSVLATDEARFLAQLLTGARAPADPARIATAICTPLFGLPAEEIREVARGEGRYTLWSRRMTALNRAFGAGGPVALVSALLSLGEEDGAAPLAADLFSRPRGEAIASRLRHIAELAQVRPTTGGDELRAFAAWLDSRRHKGASAEEGAQLRPETDGDAVAVMTVHKAKGLEFPVVYVPFASRSPRWGKSDRPIEYHDPSRGDAPFADLGSADADDHLRLSRSEEEAEETRLLYVALTRARHLVKLVWWPATSYNRPGPADALLRAHTGGGAGGTGGTPAKGVVDALSESSGGAFCASELETRPAPVASPTAPREVARLARPPEIALVASRTKGSFSTLVEGSEPAALAPGAREALLPGEAEVPLGDFPAGRDPGIMVHEILSAIDFCGGDRASLDRAVAGALGHYGLDACWKGPLADALAGALDTPLDADGSLRLNRIPRAERLDELRFTFSAPRDGGAPRVTAAALAEAMGKDAGDGWAGACAARARELDFDPFDGGVSGVIDLVFRHRDVFYVADYKTNRLGRRWEEYAPACLKGSMLEHHYYLQYHLYALALHRYLAQRITDYSYEAKFGGVYYLFLRGMSPLRGQGTGVLFARPGEAAIRALDSLFGARGGRRP